MIGLADRPLSRRGTTLRGLCMLAAVLFGAGMYYGLVRYSFYLDLQPEAELAPFSATAEPQTGKVIAVTGLLTKSTADRPPEAMRAMSALADDALQLERCRKSRRNKRCSRWSANTAKILGYAVSPKIAAMPISTQQRDVSHDGWRLKIWPANHSYTIVATLDKSGSTLIPVTRKAMIVDAQENPARFMAETANTTHRMAWAAFLVSTLAFVVCGTYSQRAHPAALASSCLRALLIAGPSAVAMILSHTPWLPYFPWCGVAAAVGLLIWGKLQYMLHSSRKRRA
jgi:hypothetical protein